MDIIIKPVITEKMTEMGESLNRYGFIVNRKANKLQIKKAIEDLYGVDVVSVNTMTYRGKTKSRFTKTGIISGKAASFKKAIITVAEGETIDFYRNTNQRHRVSASRSSAHLTTSLLPHRKKAFWLR